MKIKSPYNFAPAPDEKDVYKPEWAEHVSHDVPFSDSKSGCIDFTITAASPIFVRNGATRNDYQKPKPDFSYKETEEGRHYFIPGSSIKGMIRNVLEIISCSRLNNVDGISAKDEILFGLRDMNNIEYSKFEIRDVKSGWLRKVNDDYFIFPCSHHRIAISEVENRLANGGTLKGISAVMKSETVGAGELNKWRNFIFKEDLGNFVGKLYKFSDTKSDEEIEWRIVLYGDIDNKRYDYIFSKPSTNKIPVSKDLFHKFSIIEESQGKNSLFNFYNKNQITDIPVFFKSNKNNAEVRHFGFSKLYRLNNPQFLKDIQPFKNYQQPEKAGYQPDLAELIFGYINKGKGAQSLKGRVTFSHASSENAQICEEEQTRILNSPKLSFYPAYLKQGNNSELKVQSYKTYHSDDPEARGFKRYPVHSTIKPNDPNIGTDAMKVNFIPVQEGAVFKGRMVYHNLQTVELGALLSALSFHNNANRCFHSLGMAKPYGFGKAKIEIALSEDHLQAMQSFEFAMNRHMKKPWINSDSVKELFAMSQPPKDLETDQLLQYPHLETENDIQSSKKKNEFIEYKKVGLVLEKYSVRNKSPKGFPLSLLSQETIAFFEEQVRQKQEWSNAKHLFAERQQQIIEDLKRKVEALRAKHTETAAKLAAGINFNAVTNTKSIESLLRALKYWVATVKGTIGIPEIDQLKNRFSDIYAMVKPNGKQAWLEQVKRDMPKLNAYLNPAQLQEVVAHVNAMG